MCFVHVVSILGNDWFTASRIREDRDTSLEMQPMDSVIFQRKSLFYPTEKYDLLLGKTRIPAAK